MFLDEVGDMPLAMQAKLLRVCKSARSNGSAGTISRSTCASSPRPTATSERPAKKASFARIYTID